MAEPKEGPWSMPKRPLWDGGLVQVISEQRRLKAPRVDTDSDYAGCALTRKSTTCAHLSHAVNLLESRIWTQDTRSLSVSELEFHAGVKGASILVGAKKRDDSFRRRCWGVCS